MPLYLEAALLIWHGRYYQPEDLSKTPDKKRSSNDPCLTAFAQLGALRLNAKRTMITLSTENNEFVLAESGRTLNLQQDEDENDKLWHGVGLVTKGLGPALSYLFSAENAPSVVDVPDLTKHDDFKDRDKVKQEQGLRSMACVPLRTQLHSIVIGTYIVVHDEVREPLSELDIQFMTDMAITVMDYLEVGRRKQVQFRSERMVKAMGLFIEGKSSLREWWLERGHQSQGTTKKRSRDATPLDRLADAEFGVQETTDYFSRNSLHGLMDDGSRPSVPHSPSSAPSTTPSQIDRTDGRPPIPRGDTMLTDTTPSTLMSHSWHQRNSSVTTFDDTNTDPTPDPEKQSSVAFDLPPNPVVQDESKELQNALLSNDVRGVFARSSNLIREAIGVQGVVYFDASVGSFGGGADKNVMEEKAPGAFHAENAVTTTTSEDDNVPKASDTDAEVTLGNQQNGESDNNYCNILGFSTRRKSTLHGHQAPEELQKLPEQILRKLLKRYPHGKVFNFDEDGSYSSSESDHKPSLTLEGAQGVPNAGSDGNARKRRISREAEAAAILSVLPGARSVFWFPLWDQARERWFSGSLVWSTACTRTLCPIEDITYLAAFGNSTMAEISRISAQVLSKMKSDFISSISHELRSPLHGVLASVEFLQETEMTEVQTDMVQNIHASGKVLLDTINHVLDFSKVNRRSKKKRSPKRRLKKLDRRGSVDGEGEEKADVCVLSEEVIESVYAGQKISKKAFGSTNNHRHSSVGQSLVTVIVDIRYRPNWTYEIDSGAWRRILMNLFSNATKYTAGGFVKVSLEIEDDVASEKKKSRSNLVLKIQDSGMGISQEFLKHQLYKPFTQEDNLASGAGLGLSIVKAIVQDMGGKIDFTSEPGTGTEATVRIPLNASLTPKMGSLKVLDEVREKTKGLTFRLEGFDRYPDITETPTGILSSESEAAMLLKSSVQISFVDWFGMEASNCATSSTDILVVMESGLGGKSLEDVLHSHGHEQNEKAVVLVITHTYHSGPRVDSHGHFKIFYLSQP